MLLKIDSFFIYPFLSTQFESNVVFEFVSAPGHLESKFGCLPPRIIWITSNSAVFGSEPISSIRRIVHSANNP